MAIATICECGCGSTTLTGARFARGHWKRTAEGKEASSKLKTTHGMNRTKVFNTWVNIRQRCHNPNVPHYERYGARGITVCDRWWKFENFLEDMGQPPEGTELDRVDNTKGYEPGNCQWVTRSINCRNRRSTRWVEVNGTKVSMVEASEITGISYHTIKSRLKKGIDPITGVRSGPNGKQ